MSLPHQKQARTTLITPPKCHFSSIDSTNDEAKRRVESGLREDMVFIADIQTAGKGQKGRTWYSEEGGLYLTYLKFGETRLINTASQIPQEIGKKVITAIDHFAGVRPLMEWPNDILLDNKKLGGILIETSTSKDRMPYLIIGVGINLNQMEFPDLISHFAISLHQKTGILYNRDDLAEEIVKELHL